MTKDSLGDRMKNYYEMIPQNYLMRRTPVIVRVDGKAFHTFCRRFQRPFDVFLNEALNETMKYVCGNVQGVKMAERHSDEMSFLITDFDTIGTDAFFEYNVQKMVSVIASMATSEFCRQLVVEGNNQCPSFEGASEKYTIPLSEEECWPTFDARAFNIPENEIANYFYWRQNDALRNGLSMLAQSLFSHKELQGKNSSDMQEMLFSQKGINWNDVPQEKKTGYICIKKRVELFTDNGSAIRDKWVIRPAPKDKKELDEVISQISFFKETQNVDVESV